MQVASFHPPLRQAGGLIFVLLLHVGIVYALLTGLGRQVVEVLRQPLLTEIIEEVKPPPPAAKRPPPPKLAPPPPAFVPPPEVRIQAPPTQNAIAAVVAVKPAEPPPPVAQAEPAKPPVRVPAVVDASTGCTAPEYPPASRRLEESGTVVLQFLIEPDGSVVDSKIETSSGFARLDEAARSALSKCRFKAGTVDGRPEKSWARLRYVWRIE